MKYRYLVWFISLILVAIISGCGPSKPKVERLDLDKVISIMMDTLKEMDKEAAASGTTGGTVEKATTTTDKEKRNAAPITEMDAEKEKKFLENFADNLNKAQLRSTPIGVAMLDNGTVEGFEDPNKNMKKDSGEKVLFKIHIDKKRNRLIASDTIQGRHRDHSLGPGLGLMMGYMLGKMLNRQSSSGFDTGQFEQMKMSPPAQQRSVATGKSPEGKSVSGAKKRSGGSRGFSPKPTGSRRLRR
jgi:hypothetical protein